jgi:cell division protein FtsB
MTSARGVLASDRHGASRVGYRLAISIYAGLVLYCFLSLLFGPAGLTAYHRLEAKKAAMETNLGKLATLHEGLNAELESLKSDPDRAAREARSLGYLRKGETAILLGGKVERLRPINTGMVISYAETPALGDLALKEISLGVFLAVMAFLSATRGSSSSRRRR